MLFGTSLSGVRLGVTMDGYVRFIKGVLVAVGLIYWSAIPQHREAAGERISIVTFILVIRCGVRVCWRCSVTAFRPWDLLISLIGELVGRAADLADGIAIWSDAVRSA